MPLSCPDGIACLADLCANEDGVVVDVTACAEGCARLAALGVAPGMNVKMLCPGRTCLVAVGRSRLSLRGEELRAIFVERTAVLSA